MKRAHSPAIPTPAMVEGQQHQPCPLTLLRRPRPHGTSMQQAQPVLRLSTSLGGVGTKTASSSGTTIITTLAEGMSINATTTTTTTKTGSNSNRTVDLSQPAIMRAFSDSCIIPRAPLMSSSVPSPMFLESLPQLSLPPPSVEEAEAIASSEGGEAGGECGGGIKLSSSLRERMGAVAASFMQFASCPGALREEQEGGEGAKESMASAASSLTALSILLNKAFAASATTTAAAEAQVATGGAEEHNHAPLSSSLPSSATHTHTHDNDNTDNNNNTKRAAGETSFSFSAVTTSTAATTASSVSSTEEGLLELEDAASAGSAPSSAAPSETGEAPPSSADAAMGPFVLDELESV